MGNGEREGRQHSVFYRWRKHSTRSAENWHTLSLYLWLLHPEHLWHTDEDNWNNRSEFMKMSLVGTSEALGAIWFNLYNLRGMRGIVLWFYFIGWAIGHKMSNDGRRTAQHINTDYCGMNMPSLFFCPTQSCILLQMVSTSMFDNSKITNNIFIVKYKMLPKGPPFKNWNLKVPWGVAWGWISPGPRKRRSECHFNSEALAQRWPPVGGAILCLAQAGSLSFTWSLKK